MKKSAIIFGSAGFAEVVDFYLSNDSNYQVDAFTVTEDQMTDKYFRNRPLIPFEKLAEIYSPDDYEIFVAVGYRQMNAIREKICEDCRAKGYKLLSYICSKATIWGEASIGDNVFIFDDNTIQPFVSIGNGSILWSGNHIGHHSTVGEYCFISSHAVISGYSHIGSNTFVGVNATIADGIKIGARNLIGPGALMQRNTGDDEVFLESKTIKFPKSSSRFMK